MTVQHNEMWADIFRTLVSNTRREIIAALVENPPDRAVSLPEAANSPECRREPDSLSVDLIHNHLPMMAEKGFIEWEREPFCAKRGPRFDDVGEVITAIQTHDQMPQHLTEGCYFLEQDEVKI